MDDGIDLVEVGDGDDNGDCSTIEELQTRFTYRASPSPFAYGSVPRPRRSVSPSHTPEKNKKFSTLQYEAFAHSLTLKPTSTRRSEDRVKDDAMSPEAEQQHEQYERHEHEQHGHEQYEQHGQQQHGLQQRSAPENCFMCKYHGNPSVDQITRFIIDSVSSISLESLVEQTRILIHATHAQDIEPTDASVSTKGLQRHITDHMLHPRVRVAMQIRELSEMQRRVTPCCVTFDEETGQHTVNPHAMRTFLTLSNQIHNSYKTGEEKMLFNMQSTASVDK